MMTFPDSICTSVEVKIHSVKAVKENLIPYMHLLNNFNVPFALLAFCFGKTPDYVDKSD